MVPAKVGCHRSGRRRGVTPIIAEILLISITLVMGATLSAYVFGVFNIYSGSAVISIQANTVQCVASGSSVTLTLPDGAAIPAGECGMVVQNSGSSAGRITGVGPGGAFSGVTTSGYTIPAGGHADVFVYTTTTTGASVSGYLVQSNGPSLFFRTVVE